MAIFLGELGLAGYIGAKDDRSGGDNWSYKSCKAPVKLSPPTNQHPAFAVRMPFLSPNQQCRSTEGKNSLPVLWSTFVAENLVIYFFLSVTFYTMNIGQ